MSTNKARKSKASSTEAIPAAPEQLAETAIQLIPYRFLARAPENVRHTRPDEDLAEFADDIAGHDLLQSLIGYQTEDVGQTWTWIVGGGRRLAALGILAERGLIDRNYHVPVLVRGVEEAIELSLAENLARRNMSPVDEFFAFRHMRDHGATEQNLARRFGFSERYVKQRLRLANLHSDVLNALSERQITLDAAMAYASNQDAEAQAKVFRAQARSSWKPHDPDAVRRDLSMKAHHSDGAVATFVGANAYQAAGGRYDDDLFSANGRADDAPLRLIDTSLVERLAREKMQAELIPFVSAANADGAGINAGAVIAPDLDISDWRWTKPKAPAGFTLIDCQYDKEKRWNAARNCGAQVKGIVGLTSAGEMRLVDTCFFVSNDKLKEVGPPLPSHDVYRAPSQEELEQRRRVADVEMWSRRLALGELTDTRFDGIAFWPHPYESSSERFAHPTLGEGYLVAVKLFVSKADADAQVAAAEAKVDQLKAERVAAEEARRRREAGEDVARDARVAAIAAMDPPPAVIVADNQAWFRWADGSYNDVAETPGMEYEQGFDELAHILDDVREIGAVFATIDDYLGQGGGGADDAAAAAASQDRDPDRPDPYDDELDPDPDGDADRADEDAAANDRVPA